MWLNSLDHELVFHNSNHHCSTMHVWINMLFALWLVFLHKCFDTVCFQYAVSHITLQRSLENNIQEAIPLKGFLDCHQSAFLQLVCISSQDFVCHWQRLWRPCGEEKSNYNGQRHVWHLISISSLPHSCYWMKVLSTAFALHHEFSNSGKHTCLFHMKPVMSEKYKGRFSSARGRNERLDQNF